MLYYASGPAAKFQPISEQQPFSQLVPIFRPGKLRDKNCCFLCVPAAFRLKFYTLTLPLAGYTPEVDPSKSISQNASSGPMKKKFFAAPAKKSAIAAGPETNSTL